MMCSAQVTSRSNSDLLVIGMVSDNVYMTPEARMEAIWRVAKEWDRNTVGATGRYGAIREFLKCKERGTLYKRFKEIF